VKFVSTRYQTIKISRIFSRNIPGWVVVLLLLCGCASQSAAAIAPTPTLYITELPERTVVSPTLALSLPDFVAKATSVPTKINCNDTKGQIIDVEVPNKILSYPLKTKIYFPPCYSNHPKTPYPYVMMIHGMFYNYDQWDRLGADEAADELISSGEVSPFLIIMPNEEQTTANPDEEKFGMVLTDSLIPWLEENYAVCTERSCRAIGGLSRGAGWAVHIGLSRPQYFGSIGAHSLPIFIGDLAATPRWLNKIPQDELPRVYIDIGIADSGMSPASQFEQVLTNYNVPHEWYINNGEHTESYWSSHVKAYLRWYAAGWKQADPPVILN
jgi:enterochelin esterase-like enzyme